MGNATRAKVKTFFLFWGTVETVEKERERESGERVGTHVGREGSSYCDTAVRMPLSVGTPERSRHTPCQSVPGPCGRVRAYSQPAVEESVREKEKRAPACVRPPGEDQRWQAA